MERRLDGLVESRAKRCARGSRRCGEGGKDGCIPRHSETIDIEETVSNSDLCLSGVFCVDSRVVRDELREVVLMNLLAESIYRNQ
jgi:hypothetical protein